MKKSQEFYILWKDGSKEVFTNRYHRNIRSIDLNHSGYKRDEDYFLCDSCFESF